MPKNTKGQEVLHLKEVQDIANHYGQPCHHPLVGVFDLICKKGQTPPPRIYGTFSILFLNYTTPDWTYGRSSNKLLSGSAITIAPGQYMVPAPPTINRNLGIGLYFSPNLIYGTQLGSLIWTYRFLDYKFNNCIFLKDNERELFMETILQLKSDLEMNGEELNIIYITKKIEMLMEILAGAYKRYAYLYRSTTDDIFANFEDNLRLYLMNWDSHEKQLPKVSYFAHLEGITHAHLGEVMKDLMAMNANKYIMHKMLMISKEWLAQKKEGREVARRLGFSDAPHFSRFFVNISGELPSAFKRRRMEELRLALKEYVEDAEKQPITPPPFTLKGGKKSDVPTKSQH